MTPDQPYLLMFIPLFSPSPWIRGLFFLMCGSYLKSLLNLLLQHCFCFMFWGFFFGLQACGISASWPGIEPAPPALESEVLTTGTPGKSLWHVLKTSNGRSDTVSFPSLCCCSAAKSCLTLWFHGLQHARLPCPTLSPAICSDSCPLSRWCLPTISSSVSPFPSCPQSFPASGSFPMSQLSALRMSGSFYFPSFRSPEHHLISPHGNGEALGLHGEKVRSCLANIHCWVWPSRHPWQGEAILEVSALAAIWL